MLINEPAALPQSEAITITIAQLEDIPALQATAAASWWATYGSYLPASFIENFLVRAYSADSLAADLTNSSCRFLLAKADNALIGFGQVGPTMPRRDDAPVAQADLYRLYLLPQWQGRGIGRRLLTELEEWLREQGYPHCGAYVHEQNTPAQGFYLHQGFVRQPACDVQDEWYLVKTFDH